jgi:glutaminyl-peptide cyclotransferase
MLKGWQSMVGGRALSVVFAGFAIIVASSVYPAAQFNGGRCFEALEKVCSFGPRVADRAAHDEVRDYIEAELRTMSLKVMEQKFEAYSLLLDKTLTFTNIVGVLNPETTGAIAISAHWDSRPIADQDPQAELRRQPIIGANDGASGIALLLELARVFQENHTPGKIVFLFFDGEDYGTRTALDEYCLGSTYMAAHPVEGADFDLGINVDMIGDKDLRIKIEGYSYKLARSLVEEFWSVAQGLYPAQFSRELYPAILDDHVPFLRAGKPYIDVIDYDYAFWHTHADTPDKCSPRSLEIVGNTIMQFVEKRLQKSFRKNP